ncbi:hypothetical protein IC234_18685 [Hymenobacter sp. BT189]|uniref:Uncharacterized protein n=1 Tax=Hymenobacter armeniacus TaxID=2771358 RepID=A0ABR8JW21_9BACT|nr:hypothetical protein [Hymenobacter armeniacus]
MPVITEKSVGKARIGMPITQLRELYKGCTFSPAHMLAYGFDDTAAKPNGVMVKSGSRQLFLYFADWQTKKKVACLLAFHPAYKTATGIHVGSTSGQLKVALPAVTVGPNELMTEMQIAAVDRSEGGEEKQPIIQYVFNKQGFLGKNKDSIEPSEIAVLNAKISWIQVFPNP